MDKEEEQLIIAKLRELYAEIMAKEAAKLAEGRGEA